MMDSGNSGSMQSSSGGDEEYDSRTTDSMSFFNQSGRVVGQTMGLDLYSSANFAPISNLPLQQQQPPPSLSLLPNHSPPTLFDLQAHSLPSYSHSPLNQAPNQSQNPLYNTSTNNLDLVWSRSGTSYANPGTFGTQSLLRPTSSPSMALPAVIEGSDRRPTQRASDQEQQPAAAPPKNSRKRTRASRRAPTTVLTTDTSNFRQMVQEFTGIPAAAFSAAASSYSRRLDLFGGGGVGGGMSGLMRSGHLDTLGPLYPFRPSAQKFQPNLSSFLAAPNSSNSISATNNTLSTSAGTTNAAGSSSISGPSNTSYQTAPSNASVISKQQNQQSKDVLNMHNPFMAYQSLLQQQQQQQQQHQQQPNISMFGSKSSDIPQELGMAQEQAENNLGPFQSQDQQIGLENVSSRNNEGTLESWICPSD